MVVGGTNDPATPIRWAEEMTAAMGPNATMVKYTGEGHGALLVSTCVTDIEAGLLADLDLPDEGTVCDPDPKVERPDWFDDLDLGLPSSISDVVALPAVNAALGLTDTDGYGEVRTTALSPRHRRPATRTRGGRLRVAGQPGHRHRRHPRHRRYFAPNGDILVVIMMGQAPSTPTNSAAARRRCRPGQTIVLFAYIPQ